MNDVETVNSQLGQAGDMIYTVQDNLEELKKGKFINNTTVNAQH